MRVDISPNICTAEQTLPRYTCRILAQLKTNKYPLLLECLHKLSPDTHPTSTCPLCNKHTHYTNYFFTCQHIHTTFDTQSSVGEPCMGGGTFARWFWGLDRPWRDCSAEASTTTTCPHKVEQCNGYVSFF